MAQRRIVSFLETILDTKQDKFKKDFKQIFYFCLEWAKPPGGRGATERVPPFPKTILDTKQDNFKKDFK